MYGEEVINNWEEGLLAPDHLHHQVSRWVYREGVINDWEEGYWHQITYIIRSVGGCIGRGD